MAGARTAAMGFNRIVDRHIDAQEPAHRQAGDPDRRRLGARRLGADASPAPRCSSAPPRCWAPLCLALSPVALLFLFGYSFTKRFTFLCHLFLGLAIAAGPAGAWIAVRGDFTLAPALLMIAVTTWIAGFDILYALADATSIAAPACIRFPPASASRARWQISALLHGITSGALVALALRRPAGRPLSDRRRGRDRAAGLRARHRDRPTISAASTSPSSTSTATSRSCSSSPR